MIRTGTHCHQIEVSDFFIFHSWDISKYSRYVPTSCLSALLLAASSSALIFLPSIGTLSKAPKLMALRIAAFCAVYRRPPMDQPITFLATPAFSRKQRKKWGGGDLYTRRRSIQILIWPSSCNDEFLCRQHQSLPRVFMTRSRRFVV